MSLKVMLNNFLRTNTGKQIIVFEDAGYKLAETQMELTYPQEIFLGYGKQWLANEREKEINSNR